MKKALVLILMAFVVNAVAFAQTYQEVVYLKNGSVIRGVIVEQIPSVSLKIRTADGSVFAYQMDEVEKITKEKVVDFYDAHTSKGHSTYASVNYKLKTGYRGFIDFGYSLGVGVWGDDRVEFSTTHGGQFTSWLFAGFGVGVNYYYDGEVIEIPVFADIRGTLPCRSNCQPFLDFKIGYTVYDATGFYMNPSIGCRFALGKNGGIHLGVGYVMQKFKIYYGRSYSKVNDGAVTFKLGFDF